jgi:LysR family glycine cleavage system transcriptional activator
LIATGKLQPVFEDKLSLEVQSHFMVYPARHASRQEVKCFVEWLRGEAGH